MRQREPQFHHEIKPIAVDFQMFHLQELLGVKSLHSEISCGTRDIAQKKKVTNEPMTRPCIMILKSFATLEHVKLVEARSAF